jgi:NADH-quinone oxidoreductase subunit N
MNNDSLNIALALPEIVLLAGICAFILAELFAGGRRGGSLLAAQLVLALPLLAMIAQPVAGTQTAFGGMYIADTLSTLLKAAAILTVSATLLISSRYVGERHMPVSEFHALAMMSLLGQMVMMSAGSLLVVYLGLELMSLSLYALVALRRDHAASTEAAMKYFILGALASGFLLYGMSMIYGGAGSLLHEEIAVRYVAGEVDRWVLVLGVVFLVAGLAFKLGAVPFHMWVPDVYHGSPSAVTLLIAGAPKLAAFAIAFRMLAEALLGVAADWQQMLLVLAIASLAIGNIVAIAQRNLKRMLAYSTISQVGFVLMGMLAGVSDGDAAGAADAWGSALFYIVTYVLTTIGTFGVVIHLSSGRLEADSLDDLRGLSRRHPGLAFVMLLLMFSLAGIPPLVGFHAKLVVLGSVLAGGMIWLAVVGVMLSLVAAFYYLRIVKLMYFDAPPEGAPVVTGGVVAGFLGLNGALVLILGLLPGPLLSLCLDAVRQALGS